MTVCVQAFINMSVVLGIVPNKGIPLPFLSYGGSSFVVMLAAVGILLNVSQQGDEWSPDLGIMRAIIAGGGTGGHLFPGIAVAREIQRRNEGCRNSFCGSRAGN